MTEAVGGLFDLTDRVAIITGGAGLLGMSHADVIARAGGVPILLDLPSAAPQTRAQTLEDRYHIPALGIAADITCLESVEESLATILQRFGRVDILINNAANNPKVETSSNDQRFSRLEHFPIEIWEADLRVGLRGSFVCSRVFGSEMARRARGTIVNIASDLALIGPDQRLYHEENLPASEQPVKPVTYSVIKSGLIGLTRYLATYWNDVGVRVNAISPGGVFNGQPPEFVQRLSSLIPLGRMAHLDEYQGAILFLCSDASSYMTGANLVVDGGRTCW